jgi:hypothetical protein
VNQFLADQGVDIPAIWDPDGVIAEAYRVEAFPSEVFIDSEGRVASAGEGAMSATKLWATADGLTKTSNAPTTTTAAPATTATTGPIGAAATTLTDSTASVGPDTTATLSSTASGTANTSHKTGLLPIYLILAIVLVAVAAVGVIVGVVLTTRRKRV